jgi:hypothetical protein
LRFGLLLEPFREAVPVFLFVEVPLLAAEVEDVRCCLFALLLEPFREALPVFLFVEVPVFAPVEDVFRAFDVFAKPEAAPIRAPATAPATARLKAPPACLSACLAVSRTASCATFIRRRVLFAIASLLGRDLLDRESIESANATK